jgi:hypothetical protein
LIVVVDAEKWEKSSPVLPGVGEAVLQKKDYK